MKAVARLCVGENRQCALCQSVLRVLKSARTKNGCKRPTRANSSRRCARSHDPAGLRRSACNHCPSSPLRLRHFAVTIQHQSSVHNPTLNARMGRALVTAVAVLVMVLAAGTGSAAGDRLPPGLLARLAVVQQRARAHPGQPATRATQLLAAVIAGLPANSVVDARLALPPKGWSATTPGVVGHSWLYLRMHSSGESTYHQRIAEWEAEVIAGGFRQASHDLGLDGLRGVSTTVVDPRRRASSPFIGVIATALGGPAPTEAHMRQRIEANLSHDRRFADAHLGFVHAARCRS
jgi:hypothetical protein